MTRVQQPESVREPAPPPASAAVGKRKSNWIGRNLFLLMFGIPLLAWVAPQVLSPFANQPDVVKLLAPDLPRNLRIGKASLNWQAPVLLKDVALVGNDGKSLLTASSVTSEQTLWDLFKNANSPLTLHFEGLSAQVIVPVPAAQGRINLDELANALSRGLSTLISFQGPRVQRPTALHLKDGHLQVLDSSGTELTRFDPISGECILQPAKGMDADNIVRSQLKLEMPVSLPPGKGSCRATADWLLTNDPAAPGDLTCRLEFSQLPVDALHPLLDPMLDGGVLTGVVDGSAAMELTRDAQSVLSGHVKLNIGDAAASSQSLYVLREGSLPVPFVLQWVQSELAVQHVPQLDQLQFSKFLVESQPVDIALQGAVSDLKGMMNANISGTVRCEIQELFDVVPESVRAQIQVDGLHLAEVAFRGPLRKPVANNESATSLADATPPEQPPTPSVSLQGLVGWNRARAYGLDSPAGQLKVALEQNRLLLEPVEVSVNEGRLRSLPWVELRTDGSHWLQLEPAIVLEDIRLTDQLCRDWLRFLSPVLANATSVSGNISVSTTAGTLPLDNLSAGQLQGTLLMREGQIGAGPLVQPILQMVSQIQTIAGLAGNRPAPADLRLNMVPQEVAFALQDGRVHHQNLMFKAGDVQLSTSGSVGLDESLQVMLKISLPDKWFANRGPVLSSLQGESINVAIAGTLDRPLLDPRPLADFGKRIGTRAAGGLILDLINKGIERRQQRDNQQ